MVVSNGQYGPTSDKGTKTTAYAPYVNGKPMKMIVKNGRRVTFDPFTIENQAVRDFVHGEYYYSGYWKNANEKTQPNKVQKHLAVVGNPGYYNGKVSRDTVKVNAADWTSKCRAVPFAITNFGTGKTLTVKNNSRTMTFQNPEPVTMVQNLVPGNAEWYVTNSGSSTKLEQGTVRVAGQLRMIYVPHVGNVRDIGGWPVVDGNNVIVNRVAYNRVLRGATTMPPYDETDIKEDCRILVNEVGVTMQIDLQDDKMDADAGIYNVPRTSVMSTIKSGFDFRTLHNDSSNPTYSSPGMQSYKKFFLTVNDAEAKKVYKWLSEHLSANQKNCAYINCYSGKDRTGCTIALLLALCGCEEDSIIKDWELSNFWNWNCQYSREDSGQWLTIDRVYSSNSQFYNRDDIEVYTTRRRLGLWFKMLDYIGGSTLAEKAKNYLLSLGLTSDEINSLKRSLIKPMDIQSFIGDFTITCNYERYGEYHLGTGYYCARKDLMVDGSGKVKSNIGSDMCCTEYIPLDGHKRISTNAGRAGEVVVALYDSNHAFKKALTTNSSGVYDCSGYAYAVINYPYKTPTDIVLIEEPSATPIDWNKIASWSGEKFMTTPYTAPLSPLTQSFMRSKVQGAANFGKWLVQAFEENRYLALIDLEAKSMVKVFEINSAKVDKWHNNSIAFGVRKIQDSDEMPLLYLSSGFTLADGKNKLAAYRIYQDGGEWKAELKQTIILDGLASADGDPMSDMAIDREAGVLYVGKATMRRFRLDAIPNDEVVTLTVADAVDEIKYTWGDAKNSANNGFMVHDGKMIHLAGGPNYQAANVMYLVVSDLNTPSDRHIINMKDLGYWQAEPEGMFVYNGEFYVVYPQFVLKVEFND